MGCGLHKLVDNKRSSTQDIKHAKVNFKISDAKRMKKKGLFIVHEVSLSQEYSCIKGLSSSDHRIRMRSGSKDNESDM